MKDTPTNKKVKEKTDDEYCDSVSKEVLFQNQFDGSLIAHESHQRTLNEKVSTNVDEMLVDSEEHLNTQLEWSSDRTEVIQHKSNHTFEQNIVQVSSSSKIQEQNAHFEEFKLHKQDKISNNFIGTSQQHSFTSSKDANHNSFEKNSNCCYNGIQFSDQNQLQFDKQLPQFLQNGIDALQPNKNFSSIAKIGHQDTNQKCLIGEFVCESQTLCSQKSFKSEHCDIESKNRVKQESLIALPSTNNMSQNEKLNDVDDNYSEVQLNKALSHISTSNLANSSQVLPNLANEAQELESILKSFESESRKNIRRSNDNLENGKLGSNNHAKETIVESQNDRFIEQTRESEDAIFESNQTNVNNNFDGTDLQTNEITNESKQDINLAETNKITNVVSINDKVKDGKIKKTNDSNSKVTKNDSKNKTMNDKKTPGTNSNKNIAKDLKEINKTVQDSPKLEAKIVKKEIKNPDFQDSAEKPKIKNDKIANSDSNSIPKNELSKIKSAKKFAQSFVTPSKQENRKLEISHDKSGLSFQQNELNTVDPEQQLSNKKSKQTLNKEVVKTNESKQSAKQQVVQKNMLKTQQSNKNLLTMSRNNSQDSLNAQKQEKRTAKNIEINIETNTDTSQTQQNTIQISQNSEAILSSQKLNHVPSKFSTPKNTNNTQFNKKLNLNEQKETQNTNIVSSNDKKQKPEDEINKKTQSSSKLNLKEHVSETIPSSLKQNKQNSKEEKSKNQDSVKNETRIKGLSNSEKKVLKDEKEKSQNASQVFNEPTNNDNVNDKPVNFKYTLFRESQVPIRRKNSRFSFEDLGYKKSPSLDKTINVNSIVFDVPKASSIAELEGGQDKLLKRQLSPNCLNDGHRTPANDRAKNVMSPDFYDQDFRKGSDIFRPSTFGKLTSNYEIRDRVRTIGSSVFVPLESRVLDQPKGFMKPVESLADIADVSKANPDESAQNKSKNPPAFRPSKFNKSKIFQILKLQTNTVKNTSNCSKDFRFSESDFKNMTSFLYKKFKIQVDSVTPDNDPFVKLQQIKNTKVSFFGVIGNDSLIVNMMSDNHIILEEERQLYDNHFSQNDQGLYLMSVKNEFNINVLVLVLYIKEHEFSEDYNETKQLIRVLKAISSLCKSNLIGIRKSEVDNLNIDENVVIEPSKDTDKKPIFQRFKVVLDHPRPATISAANPIMIGNGKSIGFYTKKTTLAKKEGDVLSIVYKSSEVYDKFRKHYYVRIRDFNSLNPEFVDHFLNTKHKQLFKEMKRNLNEETRKFILSEEKSDPVKLERYICKIVDLSIVKLMHQLCNKELMAVKQSLTLANPVFEEYFAKLDNGQIDAANAELKEFYTHLEESFTVYFREEERQAVKSLAVKLGLKQETIDPLLALPKKSCFEELLKHVKKRSYKLEHFDTSRSPQKTINLEDIVAEIEFIQKQNPIEPSDDLLRREGEQMIAFLTDSANNIIEREKVFEKLKKDNKALIEKSIKKKLTQVLLKRLLETDPQPKKVWITSIKVSKVLTSGGVPEWEFVYERGDEFDGLKEYKVFSIEKEAGVNEDPNKPKDDAIVGMLAKRTQKFKLIEGESMAQMVSLPEHQRLLAVNLFKGSELRIIKKMQTESSFTLPLDMEIVMLDYNEKSHLMTIVFESLSGLSYSLFKITESFTIERVTENVSFNEKLSKLEPKKLIQGIGNDFYIVDSKKDVFRFEHMNSQISKFGISSQKVRNVLYLADKNSLVLILENRVFPVSLETGKLLLDSKVGFDCEFRGGAVGDVDGKVYVFFVQKSKIHFSPLEVVFANQKTNKFSKVKKQKADDSVSCCEFKTNGLLEYLPYIISNPLRLASHSKQGTSIPAKVGFYIADSDPENTVLEGCLKAKLREIEEGIVRESGEVVNVDRNSIFAYSGFDNSHSVSRNTDESTLESFIKNMICLSKTKIAEIDSDKLVLVANEKPVKSEKQENSINLAKSIHFGAIERLLVTEPTKKIIVLSNVENKERDSDDLFEELIGSSFKSINSNTVFDEKPSVFLSIRLTSDCIYLIIDFKPLRSKKINENLLLAFVNSCVSEHTVFSSFLNGSNLSDNAFNSFVVAAHVAKDKNEIFKNLLSICFSKIENNQNKVVDLLKLKAEEIEELKKSEKQESNLLNSNFTVFNLSENEENYVESDQIRTLVDKINSKNTLASRSVEQTLIDLKEAIAKAMNEDFEQFGESNFDEVLVFLKFHFDHYVRKGTLKRDLESLQRSAVFGPDQPVSCKSIKSFEDLPVGFNYAESESKFKQFDIHFAEDKLVVLDKDVILGENYKGLNDLFDKLYFVNRTDFANWEHCYKQFIEQSAENRLVKVWNWIEVVFEQVTAQRETIKSKIEIEKANFKQTIDEIRNRYMISDRLQTPELTNFINYEFILNSKPCHFVLCLDDSGSMRGKPWEELQLAVLGFVESRENSEKEKLSIVQFNDEAEVMCEFITLMEFDINKHLKFRSGGTNFEAAISKSHELFLKNSIDNYRPIFIFMTDGRSDTGEFEMQQLAQDLLPRKLVTVTIMFNSQVLLPSFKKASHRNSKSKKGNLDDETAIEQKQMEEQLTKLADLAKGKYINSKDGDQLKSHFKQISSALDGTLRISSCTKI
jgi:hypothetical protein